MEKYLKGKWNSDFSFPFNLFSYLTVSLFICLPLTALGKKKPSYSSTSQLRKSIRTSLFVSKMFLWSKKEYPTLFLTDSFIKLLIKAMYCKELSATAQVCFMGCIFLTTEGGAPRTEAVGNLDFCRWMTQLLSFLPPQFPSHCTYRGHPGIIIQPHICSWSRTSGFHILVLTFIASAEQFDH